MGCLACLAVDRARSHLVNWCAGAIECRHEVQKILPNVILNQFIVNLETGKGQ